MPEKQDLIIPEDKEYTMSAEKANLYALLFFLPVALLMIIPYFLLHKFDKDMIGHFKGTDAVWFIMALFTGILVHEAIHGLFLGYFSPSGYKSISFGVHWKMLTPYCHCSDALQAKHYRIGLMMPLVLLGLLPFGIAMTTGHVGIFLFSIIFTLSAGGDMLIFWLMRKIKSTTIVKDHPHKIGFYVAE
jgi:hypothetical protein